MKLEQLAVTHYDYNLYTYIYIRVCILLHIHKYVCICGCITLDRDVCIYCDYACVYACVNISAISAIGAAPPVVEAQPTPTRHGTKRDGAVRPLARPLCENSGLVGGSPRAASSGPPATNPLHRLSQPGGERVWCEGVLLVRPTGSRAPKSSLAANWHAGHGCASLARQSRPMLVGGKVAEGVVLRS